MYVKRHPNTDDPILSITGVLNPMGVRRSRIVGVAEINIRDSRVEPRVAVSTLDGAFDIYPHQPAEVHQLYEAIMEAWTNEGAQRNNFTEIVFAATMLLNSLIFATVRVARMESNERPPASEVAVSLDAIIRSHPVVADMTPEDLHQALASNAESLARLKLVYDNQTHHLHFASDMFEAYWSLLDQ